MTPQKGTAANERQTLPQDNACRGEIFIVEDDPAVRDLLAMLFSRQGYDIRCFSDGSLLLDDLRRSSPLCIILDVHIPGKSGIEVLKELTAQNQATPVFIISGKGDIPMAVNAIRNGALDFIEKPFLGSEVVARVQEGMAAHLKRKTSPNLVEKRRLSFPGRESLTEREKEVLSELAGGATNKVAGRRLGISHRTIEVHRASIMLKLGARSATDLMRIVLSDSSDSAA